MSPSKYTLLSKESLEADEKGHSRFLEPAEVKKASSRSIAILVLVVALIVSVSANARFIYNQRIQTGGLHNERPSQHAGLTRNRPMPVNPDLKYGDVNRTLQDRAWNDPRLNSWSLFVALDEEYVQSQGLPHSMRWPWDDNKGVYILTAAHELHCVNVLRSYINEMDDQVPDEKLTWSYSHSIHCLNILRDTVMCNADDSPMYTGHVNENVHYKDPIVGRGMIRMCRDWDALLDWSNERSACYLSTDRHNASYAEIDRYKHCPNGSRPWEDL